MAVVHAFSSFLFYAVFWGFVSLDNANGLPEFVVSSGKPKCYSVEVPKETYIRIHYTAPGMLCMMLSCGNFVFICGEWLLCAVLVPMPISAY